MTTRETPLDAPSFLDNVEWSGHAEAAGAKECHFRPVVPSTMNNTDSHLIGRQGTLGWSLKEGVVELQGHAVLVEG